MKKFCLLILLIPLFLSGCTKEANRIYTVCCIDGTSVYVFDADGVFYTYHSDGSLTLNLNPNLEAKPALQVNPSEGAYYFNNVLPGLYKGTLTSVNHYIYKLLQADGKFEISYSDCDMLDCYIITKEYSIRIIFNVHGDVRIYCSNGEAPPYINEE